jgi:HTH-type transcriptional regulator / antitoxin HipB
MEIATAADIGAAIRQRRRELGLGQQALADRVGVSRQWIVEIEQGKPRAEIGLLLKTMAALGLKLEIAAGGDARQRSTGRPAADRGHEVDLDALIERARGLP